MIILTPERRETFMFYLALFAAKLGLIVVIVLTCLEAYVRWSVNKEFTFLGGFQLEILTVSTFALIFGLWYLVRK